MHWHQSFNLSPSPLALSLAQPCHWVHVSRQYLTDPGAQEEKRGEFTSIQLCFSPACSRTDQIYHSYMISSAIWLSAATCIFTVWALLSDFDLCFPILTCYFFQNLILRMLWLGLGHKNNLVSKCFPLRIVVLTLNWFHWIPQIIEKRRRDRINHSLSELRRLVPSAFEKQVRRSDWLSSEFLAQQNCNKNQHLLPFLTRAPLNWRRLRFFRWQWIIWNCFMPWAAKVREDMEQEISVALYFTVRVLTVCLPIKYWVI